MAQRNAIEKGLKNDDIDFLIGNHKHAQNSKYIEGRVVIFDEFNPDPFLDSFPSDGEIHDSDHPGKIVSHFLEVLNQNDDTFPSETYSDVTDLLCNREQTEPLNAALEWFESNGVTRADVINLDYYNVSSFRYDATNRYAPLLTLALLCMRKVGPGTEVAPPPANFDLPRIHEAWKNSGLHENVRCVRDRNTSEIVVLRPPDLTAAEQVIGLDGLPSKRLWDLMLAPKSELDHRQVISRESFSQYLSSALNMTVNQIGDGRYPYASGRISDYDKYRFAAIKSLEESRFSLISTKKALEEYKNRKWVDPFVKQAPDAITDDAEGDQFALMNYATVMSSNAFAKENLGVVSGSPFPGYRTMRIWAGFCGEEVEIPSEGEEPTFDGVVDDIYNYLNQHYIIQAILRFGRDKRVWSEGGSVVYVNTTALPDWFDPDCELTIETGTKRTRLIEFLVRAKWSDKRRPLSEQNVTSLKEHLGMDPSYIAELLEQLHELDLVTMSDRGRGGSTLYQWNGDDHLMEVDVDGKTHLLQVGEKIHLVSIQLHAVC